MPVTWAARAAAILQGGGSGGLRTPPPAPRRRPSARRVPARPSGASPAPPCGLRGGPSSPQARAAKTASGGAEVWRPREPPLGAAWQQEDPRARPRGQKRPRLEGLGVPLTSRVRGSNSRDGVIRHGSP